MRASDIEREVREREEREREKAEPSDTEKIALAIQNKAEVSQEREGRSTAIYRKNAKKITLHGRI